MFIFQQGVELISGIMQVNLDLTYISPLVNCIYHSLAHMKNVSH